MTEIIEGEIVDEQHETLPAVRDTQSPTLFGTDDPVKVIEGATRIATPLAGLVRKQGLSVNIQGREHVKVEGWTLLGSMLGVFPVVVWTRKMENGWEARVEARTRDGAVIGAAEAECTRDENQWSLEPTGRNGNKLPARDDYALRSMAQTRATSKALRMPLGFVMELAGFAATPAEEMTSDGRDADPHGFAGARADNVLASEKQKDYIRSLAKKLNLDAGDLDSLTKNQASERIKELKNGAGIAGDVAATGGGSDTDDIPF